MKYNYELRAGKKLQRLLGEIAVSNELIGKTVVLPYCDPVGSWHIKKINVPISYYMQDYRTIKICLDVSHKSKGQVKILLEMFPELK